ncbi:hypothetical protein UlMin_012262 [Ulmus minor]
MQGHIACPNFSSKFFSYMHNEHPHLLQRYNIAIKREYGQISRVYGGFSLTSDESDGESERGKRKRADKKEARAKKPKYAFERSDIPAGSLFDVSGDSDYVHTLLAKGIDEYASLKSKALGSNDEAGNVDPRLEAIVERLLNKCILDGKYQQAMGIAIECRRLDKLEEAITTSDNVQGTLSYCINVSHSFVNLREYRREVLQLLVKVYQKLPSPDYLSICQCLMFLDEPEGVASILEKLLHSENKDDALLAFQIAFDLVENEHQAFLLNVRDRLSVPKVQHTESAQPKSKEADTSQNENSAPEDVQMTEESSCEPDPSEVIYSERLTKIKGILSGETSIQLTLQFLYSHNKSDLLILKTIKQSVEMRNSVCHSATIYANAIMHAGITVDTFLRENLDWLSRATNWAKFSATAGLGVIHRGHLQQGRSLMAPYLPQGAAGGALFQCRLSTMVHEIYEDIKTVLYTDSAVAGEAAGISLGLLMVGTASEKASEMLAYAHETQHEKIIRGLALGIALTVYGREEEADTLIEEMTRDQDPILHYGGMYALALAYSGTANNKAIRQLLHFVVSDVSDDVRRTAVLALGFVLYSDPEQTPRIVSLLSESYNPHVRYGAALAVGISCAGTGLSEAISLLEPLTLDVVDFVRQGALIAMAMVMVQTSTYPTGHGPNLIMAGLKHLYDLVLVFYLKAILYQHSRYAKFQICNLGAYSCNLSLIYFISLGILFSSTIIYFFYSSHNFLFLCTIFTLSTLFQAIWPYSGHYHSTEVNFREFISFLEENHVDLSNVKVNFFIVFLRLYK